MTALLSYQRLLLDLFDNFDRPIRGNYLIDLNALLNDYSLENNEMIAKRMVFSLIQVFRFFENQFKKLIMFLKIVLNREPPSLHVFKGFCDQY